MTSEPKELKDQKDEAILSDTQQASKLGNKTNEES